MPYLGLTYCKFRIKNALEEHKKAPAIVGSEINS